MANALTHTPALAPREHYAGPKRALILAGGGMRVAYHAGVLRALEEAGLRFSHVDGTSGGIINTAMVLSGVTPVDMCNRWRSLKVMEAVSPMPFHEYLKGQDMMAMCDADGIINKMFPHLGIDVNKINAATGMTGTFNVCNFTRKTNEAIPHDRVDLDFIIAGMSLPIFMPAIRKGDDWYTDSVWLKDANLIEAVRRGAEELWVLWIINNTPEYKMGFFNQYVHMIEMSACGSLIDEFERIAEINDRISKGETPYGHTRPIKVHVIKPRRPLPLDPELFLNHITTAGLINLGYADAKHYLREASPDGLPLQPETLMMTADNKPGVSFRETMTGGFSLGETDPRAGEKKGDAAGTKLSIHCEIDIHDIYRFMEDPDHSTPITARIDFPPLGMNLSASSAIFNLFRKGEEPKTKYFVYEAAFEANGEQYYFAGKKRVHDDPGFDMWADITTLFSLLHKGTDATGPVVGAGVIYIKREQLMGLIPTFRATNTSGAIESAKVLADFGRFFMGEIWDSYGKF
ncbi:MAG TPA: patatin-like phospholipase family protein [Pyrinomonadaceae bacterium]|nr:patatin-like phospholipase family protein [Pyrinomonadaceae bacterium]